MDPTIHVLLTDILLNAGGVEHRSTEDGMHLFYKADHFVDLSGDIESMTSSLHDYY